MKCLLQRVAVSEEGNKVYIAPNYPIHFEAKIDLFMFLFFSSGGTPVKNSKSPGNRILVRTCDGLELRDPPYYPNPGTQGHELEAGGYNPHSGYHVHRNFRFAY